jgi:dolichol-phosphate mannosyltransferase
MNIKKVICSSTRPILSSCVAARINIEVYFEGIANSQTDPNLISDFVAPITSGKADYTKGNRFFDNAALSFATKLSFEYGDLFDLANGYTAIHADVATHLPF